MVRDQVCSPLLSHHGEQRETGRDGVPATRPFAFGYKVGAVDIVLRIVRRQID